MPWQAPHFLGGPVLEWELVRNSRRLGYRLAALSYLGWLGVPFLFTWALADAAARSASARPQLELAPWEAYESWQASGDRAQEFLLGQCHLQVWLVLLLTPAAVVGGLAKEKEQNTLLALFGSELTSGEIVLGKALGRAALLAGPLIASAPVLAAVAPFAEVRGTRIALVLVQALVILLAAAGISLLVSVWTKRMSDALMACYASLLIGYFTLETVLADIRLPNWLDPFAIQDQLLSRWSTLDRKMFIGHLALWAAIGAICLAIASWRLRPVAIKSLDHAPPRWLWAFRMPMGDQPVQWRERHVIGVAPLPILRQVPRGMARLGVFTFSILVAGTAFDPTGGRRLLFMIRHGDFAAMGMLVQSAAEERILIEVGIMGILLLLASGTVALVRATQTIPEEIRRKTWDDLMVTPLSIQEIGRGKSWGISQALLLYAFIYALPMMALAIRGGFMAVIVAGAFLAASAILIALASVIGVRMALPDVAPTGQAQTRVRLEKVPSTPAPEALDDDDVIILEEEAPRTRSVPKSRGRRLAGDWFLAGFQILGALAGAAFHMLNASMGLDMGSDLLMSVCAGLINGFLLGLIFVILSRIAGPGLVPAAGQREQLFSRLKTLSLRSVKWLLLVTPVLAAIFIRWTHYPVGPCWINYYKVRMGMTFPEAVEQLGGVGQGLGRHYCLTFSPRDRRLGYEDSHLHITLGFGPPPGLIGPIGSPRADVAVESRGMWNGCTGPILEIMGFGEASSPEGSLSHPAIKRVRPPKHPLLP
jgi:hypothetical protein